jgi:hypothetical protein
MAQIIQPQQNNGLAGLMQLIQLGSLAMGNPAGLTGLLPRGGQQQQNYSTPNTGMNNLGTNQALMNHWR